MTRCCAGVLILFMGSILLRFFTRNILIEKLNMNNAFTRAVFFDAPDMEAEPEAEAEKTIDTSAIDWTALYPFEDTAGVEDEPPGLKERIDSVKGKIEDTAGVKYEPPGLKERIDSVKGKIEDYTEGNLINRQMFVELAKQYEKSFGWNILTTGEVVIDLGDGYLTGLVKKNTPSTTAAFADGFSAFHDFLQELGVGLLYVQTPHKIAPDDGVSGVTDFSNENADSLIAALSLQGITCLDLRENIREERLDNRRLFYKTDHHWKAETGLWASAVLMKYLNEHCGFTFDTRMAAPERYRATVYADLFLGSLGRQVTLAQTQPEDFILLSPLFDTDVSLTIPDLNIDTRGDFDVLIDRRQLERKNYYELNPYAAYVYGDKPVITIHNNRVHDGKKILLIKDSFAEVVSPFLSTGVEYLHILDLRYFNGSARTYIAEHLPDIVIVLYNPSVINLEYEKMFDFR
jgi:hypothetical protein